MACEFSTVDGDGLLVVYRKIAIKQILGSTYVLVPSNPVILKFILNLTW